MDSFKAMKVPRRSVRPLRKSNINSHKMAKDFWDAMEVDDVEDAMELDESEDSMDVDEDEEWDKDEIFDDGHRKYLITYLSGSEFPKRFWEGGIWC